ncbi:MAG TPA: ABC transporter permease [Candidatus Sulfopaludibacter sp.]|nr:ABC transporter permease [Candidatus Sulfopaludibacter sp.]
MGLLKNLFRKSAVETDLDQELRAYLDQLIDRNLRAGMSAGAARRAARIELGGLDQVKEEVRQARAGQWLEQILQDVRYGLRTLRKNPGFTCVAVLALALGIGANTAMFSVTYGVLLRPLIYPDSSRIAVVCLRYYPRDFAYGTLCLRDFEMWKANNHAFEEPAIFSNIRLDLGGTESAPEQVLGASVTSGFFPALRVAPLLGRTFADGEDQAASPSLVVIGEALWRRRFGGSRDVLGRSILIGGAPFTVIGVMPNGVRCPSVNTEAWVNLKQIPATRYGPWIYRGLARLKPGVTMEQAQADTNATGLRMMQQNPEYKRLTMPVLELRDWFAGDMRKPVEVLMGAVLLVLLVAVVNVANLLLARGTARDREMALRLSLGAERGRLVRQLLIESLLLAGAGAVAGVALAYAAIQILHGWNPGSLPFMESVRLDGRALLFTAGITLLTGVLFGLFPALQSARANLNSSLNDGGRSGSAGRNRARTRSALVVAEIALSLMLLVGAGLFLRSLDRLERVGGGFQAPAHQILTMTISPGDRKYANAAVGLPFYRDVVRRALTLPGVESAAVSDSLPPDRQGDADTFGIEGQPVVAGEINPIVSDITAGTDYFRTLGIPLLRGRYFDEHDTASSEPVTILSESMARRFFPGRDPIGERLRASGAGSGNPWMKIVGIVGDVKYLGRSEVRDHDAAYYMPLEQNYLQRMFLAVRTSEGAPAVAEALRREIHSANPLATVARVGTMEQAMSLDVSEPRFHTLLLGLFAATALLMASVGIYGLIAFSVARRTQEIGVRVALGARPGDVVRLVVRQAATLALLGIGIGLVGSLALTRVLQTMLFATSATDPFTYVLVPLVLLGVVLAAAIIPARRATQISPVIALRYE